MRARWMLVLASLASVLAVPHAGAVPSAELSLEGPGEIVVGDSPARVDVVVTLTLRDFACVKDEAFAVTLAPSGDGVEASVAPSTLAFLIPAGSYTLAPFVGSANATVTITPGGSGGVRVVASFESPGGDCVAPGGFDLAEATWEAEVSGEEASPLEPVVTSPEPSPMPTPTPTPAPSPAEDAPGGEAPVVTSPRRPTQSPPGSGFIGDFEPEESAKSAPGFGVVLVVLAVVVVGALWRKR